MSLFLLNSLANVHRTNLPVVSSYVFIFVCLVFIYIKIYQPKRIGLITQTMKIEEKKFDTTSGLMDLGIAAILMQISYVLLFSVGIWFVTTSNYSLGTYFPILLFVSSIYFFQLLAFYIFSGAIIQENRSFFRHRLTHFEFYALLFLPIFLILTYIPYDYKWLIPSLLGICLVFSLIRSSIFLSRYVSLFHNVLYLCTLELVPVLFLIKLVLK